MLQQQLRRGLDRLQAADRQQLLQPQNELRPIDDAARGIDHAATPDATRRRDGVGAPGSRRTTRSGTAALKPAPPASGHVGARSAPGPDGAGERRGRRRATRCLRVCRTAVPRAPERASSARNPGVRRPHSPGRPWDIAPPVRVLPPANRGRMQNPWEGLRRHRCADAKEQPRTCPAVQHHPRWRAHCSAAGAGPAASGAEPQAHKPLTGSCRSASRRQLSACPCSHISISTESRRSLAKSHSLHLLALEPGSERSAPDHRRSPPAAGPVSSSSRPPSHCRCQSSPERPVEVVRQRPLRLGRQLEQSGGVQMHAVEPGKIMHRRCQPAARRARR